MVNCSPHEVCFGFTKGEKVQFFKTVLTCKSLDCLCAFTVSEICPRESLPNDPCYPFEKVKIVSTLDLTCVVLFVVPSRALIDLR